MTRTPSSYFDELYRDHVDPWGFESSWYEERKYALTLASLPDRRYGRAFEPGCSIGVLTKALASRCDRLLAVDGSEQATATASARVAGCDHVEVRRATIPDDWPDGPFDLLVLSEICYYFDLGELDVLVARATSSLAPNATVVAVHWTGPTDYPLTAAQTHARLAATTGFLPAVSHREDRFLLDVWRYRPTAKPTIIERTAAEPTTAESSTLQEQP